MVQRPVYKIGIYRLGRSRGQYVVRFSEQGRDRKLQLGLGSNYPEAIAKQFFTSWVTQREAALSVTCNRNIGEIFELYAADREVHGMCAVKMRYQWKALKDVFAHLNPQDLQTVVEVDGRERTVCHLYAFRRKQQGRARATIFDELVTLRSALNWAFKRRIIGDKPHVWIPSRPAPRDTHLSRDEVIRLVGSARAYHIKLLLVIALFTGARKSAIHELTWDRVDLELGTIDFKVSLREDDILNSSSRKSRSHVAIPQTLRNVLIEARVVAQTNHVIEYHGKPIQNSKKGIRAAVERAGLQGRYIGAHAMRHTAATMAANFGVDMREIQKMMGHDRIETTERIYAKHAPEYTRRATTAIEETIGEIEISQ